MRAAQIVGSVIGGLVLLGCAWFSYLQMFPAHACSWLYGDELAEVREVVQSVERFRSKHGRLPAPDREIDQIGPAGAASHGYLVHEDGYYTVSYLSFDGPHIGYVERGETWVCEL